MVYTLDSFKLRIPYSECEVIHPYISDNWYVAQVSENGGDLEIDESDFKVQSFTVKTEYGHTTRYLREKLPSVGKFEESEFLTIMLNSKLLDNLDGIHSGNASTVYEILISQGVANFSFDSFLVASLTDVDVKCDFIHSDICAFLQHLETFAKSSSLLGAGFRSSYREDNTMLQFSDRAKATNSLPFLKFYHKTKELYFHKKTIPWTKRNFTDKGIPVVDLLRIEYTIKNKSHFRQLMSKRLQPFNGSFNLQTWFCISKEDKQRMYEKIFSCHMEFNSVLPVPVSPRENLTPTELMILGLSETLYSKGFSLSDILILSAKYISNKHERYKIKKRVKSVLDSNILPYIPASNQKFERDTQKIFDFWGF